MFIVYKEMNDFKEKSNSKYKSISIKCPTKHN